MTKQLQGNVKKHAYVGVDGCGANDSGAGGLTAAAAGAGVGAHAFAPTVFVVPVSMEVICGGAGAGVARVERGCGAT